MLLRYFENATLVAQQCGCLSLRHARNLLLQNLTDVWHRLDPLNELILQGYRRMRVPSVSACGDVRDAHDSLGPSVGSGRIVTVFNDASGEARAGAGRSMRPAYVCAQMGIARQRGRWLPTRKRCNGAARYPAKPDTEIHGINARPFLLNAAWRSLRDRPHLGPNNSALLRPPFCSPRLPTTRVTWSTQRQTRG